MSRDSEKVTFNISKKEDFSEWYNTIVRKAELIDDRYNIKGFVVYRPYAMRMIRGIYEFLEQRLEASGHSPVLLPLLIPEENLQKEAEHVGFKAETFWVTMGGDEQLAKKYALRPTSETAFYEMYSIWIRSISDLPVKLYQSVAVYRHETRATKPLIRGREFLWIEAHDVFASSEEALDQVRTDETTMKEVVKDLLSIPVHFIRRPQWDKFKGAVDTYAADAVMPDGVTLQTGSTHYLGQKFSRAFNVTYDDKDGTHYAEQTCFGPGVSRILAAVISIHGDDSGLILPMSIAPVQIVIIPIPGEGVDEYAGVLKRTISDMNYRVELDEGEQTPGSKFYKWEFLGVPLRIEVGPREASASSVTVVDRLTKKKEQLDLEDLGQFLKGFQEAQSEALLQRAKEKADEFTSTASDVSEAKRRMSEGKRVFVVPFCSIEMDGEKCAGKVETDLGLDILGEELDAEKPKQGERCFVCGNQARAFVYVAESY